MYVNILKRTEDNIDRAGFGRGKPANPFRKEYAAYCLCSSGFCSDWVNSSAVFSNETVELSTLPRAVISSLIFRDVAHEWPKRIDRQREDNRTVLLD